MADDRRQFLKYLGAGFTGVALGATPLGPLATSRAEAGQAAPGAGAAGRPSGFTPIAPTSADALTLAPEYTHDLVALWGDPIPGTGHRVGFNADYTAFFPLTTDGREGLLCVNHEYSAVARSAGPELYRDVFARVMGRLPSPDDERHDVGVSVLHIRQADGGRWRLVESRFGRRYDATSAMAVSGPALQRAGRVAGTHSNCSGCHTPWNTLLTCEENFQNYVPEPVDTAGRGSVGGRFGLDGAHFGWVVEIDPHDPDWTPVKHTGLGRFRHENVAIRAAAGAPAVAYMGDDRTDGHVYRFVSEGRYAPGSAANRGGLLSRGRLYAAVFHADGTGDWRELADGTPIAPTPDTAVPEVPRGATTLGQVYADAGAIVTDAFRACNLIGATPTGRPEDVEVHPIDGSVYIAFTASAARGAALFSNPYGEIWRIAELGDGTGTRFTWMRWAAGGPNDASRGGHVFAAPDNLSFDPDGHLWVVTDISSARLNDAEYAAFANNGMFFIPTSGPDAGAALQFASGPCECELTGPSWTPDRQTLFLSVQHPGEEHGIRTTGMPAPRGSNWPSGRLGDAPRPGVVSIRRR